MPWLSNDPFGKTGYLNYMWNAVMGWSPDEIKIYIAHLRLQMKDKTLHTWYPHRVVYARKPEQQLGTETADR